MPVLPAKLYDIRLKQLSEYELNKQDSEGNQIDFVVGAEIYVVSIPQGKSTKDEAITLISGKILSITEHERKFDYLQFENISSKSMKAYSYRYSDGKFNHSMETGEYNMCGYRNGYNSNRVFLNETAALNYIQNKNQLGEYPSH